MVFFVRKSLQSLGCLLVCALRLEAADDVKVPYFQYGESSFWIDGQLSLMDSFQSSDSPTEGETLQLNYLEVGARVSLEQPFFGEVISRPPLTGRTVNTPNSQEFSASKQKSQEDLLYAYSIGFAPNSNQDLRYGLVSLEQKKRVFSSYSLLQGPPERVFGFQAAFRVPAHSQVVGYVFQPLRYGETGLVAGAQARGGFGVDYFRKFESIDIRSRAFYWSEQISGLVASRRFLKVGDPGLNATNLYLSLQSSFWSILWGRTVRYQLEADYLATQRDRQLESFKDLEAQGIAADLAYWLFSRSGFSAGLEFKKYQLANATTLNEKDNYLETNVSLGYFHKWNKSLKFTLKLNKLSNEVGLAGADSKAAGIPIKQGRTKRSLEYFALGLSFFTKGDI